MLEQLFGSKTRVNLLRIFLNNPSQPYYLRELARKLKTQLNSVRREVNNLEKLGIIKSVQLAPSEAEGKKSKKAKKIKRGSKKYFLADTDFILYPELKGLLLKAQLLLERRFVRKVEKMAKVKLFILTGIFVGLEGFATDMLLVGTVNRKKLAKVVRDFEKELNRNINYTFMSVQEFRYRHDITDRFLYDILEGRKIVIIDNITVEYNNDDAKKG
jgi:DNA-binding Lrp family transcriptional regulator